MLRILHVIPNLKKGGAERIVLDICNELRLRENVEIRLLTFSSDNEYTFLADKLRHDVVRVRLNLSITRRAIVELDDYNDYLNNYQPHVIHSHLFEAELITRWSPRPDILYFSHCHDKIKQFSRPSFWTIFSKRSITNAYERYLILSKYSKCNNSFITISKDVNSYINSNLPGFASNTLMLYNAISVARFKNHTPKRLLSEHSIHLISVGSFTKNKNQAFLIDVVKRLQMKGIDAQLELIGDGLERRNLEEKTMKLGLKGSVFFRGSVDNVEDYLAKADLYVHASIVEPFGLVLIEAMAARLPIVCLNGGGNQDIVINGKNGFILRNRSVASFSESILWFLNHREDYHRMSEWATEFASRFDIHDYTTLLLGLYQSKNT